MPATPLWIHRLAEGIPALASLPQEWIDRRTLEEVLGVSKWTAWRILRQCGAEPGPGGVLMCRREALAEYLDGMLRYASRKHKEIARDAAAGEMLGSRLANLPEGVELQRGELRIGFSGSADFLKKFGAVVFALQNDFERLSEFLDGPQGV